MLFLFYPSNILLWAWEFQDKIANVLKCLIPLANFVFKLFLLRMYALELQGILSFGRSFEVFSDHTFNFRKPLCHTVIVINKVRALEVHAFHPLHNQPKSTICTGGMREITKKQPYLILFHLKPVLNKYETSGHLSSVSTHPKTQWTLGTLDTPRTSNHICCAHINSVKCMQYIWSTRHPLNPLHMNWTTSSSAIFKHICNKITLFCKIYKICLRGVLH